MDRYFLKQGFSLIELAITMSVLAILATAVIPVAIKSIEVKAGEKTVLEISYLQEAARHYYYDKKAWPNSFQDLKDNGYISAQWSVNNPWAHPYIATANGATWSVATTVPADISGLLAMRLPQTTVDGAQVTSVIGSPYVDSTIPAGVIVAWSGNVADIPGGWALCDGTNGTPDLRDRFIVGARQDDNGIAKSNIMGDLLQTGGSATHTHGPGTYTTPAHNHGGRTSGAIGTNIRIDDNSGGTDWDLPVLPSHYHTIPTEPPMAILGESGEAYNVPPFYALAFIMKL